MAIFMGIDQSLTSTGVCILKHSTINGVEVLFTRVIKTEPTGIQGPEDTIIRAKEIWNSIKVIHEHYNVEFTALEGLSYASNGRATRSLAMLFGILMFNIPRHLEVIPPAIVKKYATSKGNATKEQMLDALEHVNPILHTELTELKPTQGKYDITDAYWLARYLLEDKVHANLSK